MDVKCFACNAQRTKANMELYQGISAAQLKKKRLEDEEEQGT